MKPKKSNETIVKHFYNLPKTNEKLLTEKHREVTVVMPTMTIQLISSFEKENIEYLSSKAVRILEYLKQEAK
jgi:hypothetical protein